MKYIILLITTLLCLQMQAQQYPNNEFKSWGEYGCPESWNCNNDANCKGKVTKADKIKGGAKLTVMHCFDPKKEDRSNNVNMSFDDLRAAIAKGKKLKVTVIYSFSPVDNDQAYIKIDTDFDEEVNNRFPSFFYDGNKDVFFKSGANNKMICYLNFNPENGQDYVAPQACVANAIRTTIGIMPAPGVSDVHKNTTLTIHLIKMEFE